MQCQYANCKYYQFKAVLTSIFMGRRNNNKHVSCCYITKQLTYKKSLLEFHSQVPRKGRESAPTIFLSTLYYDVKILFIVWDCTIWLHIESTISIFHRGLAMFHCCFFIVHWFFTSSLSIGSSLLHFHFWSGSHTYTGITKYILVDINELRQ